MRVKRLAGQSRVLTRILFLEDNLLFAQTLEDLLEEEGYEVVHTPNGQVALDCIYKEKFDIYLFDINVPLIDGVTLLKELRQASDNTPTIFLTSHKDKEMLKKSFNSGADDYLTKPFDNDELLLRVNALLRRSQKNTPECIALLCHDREHQCFLYDNREVELSKKEYQLLVVLSQHVNSPVPKEIIINVLWENSESSSEGSIRVYINRLKQLLPEVLIENIRGVGYKLVL